VLDIVIGRVAIGDILERKPTDEADDLGIVGIEAAIKPAIGARTKASMTISVGLNMGGFSEEMAQSANRGPRSSPA